MSDYLEKQRNAYEKVKVFVQTNSALNKFKPLDTLCELVKKYKEMGDIVVASGGAFVLPHFGHYDYFEQAASLGNKHIVCMNSDESIRKLDRCIDFVPMYGRIVSVAASHFVDNIVLFNEETPETILSYIKPDIFVKGKEWEGKKLPEEDVIVENGGRIEFVDHTYAYSSSTLVDNIKKFAR